MTKPTEINNDVYQSFKRFQKQVGTHDQQREKNDRHVTWINRVCDM